jgi:hypothetical protein
MSKSNCFIIFTNSFISSSESFAEVSQKYRFRCYYQAQADELQESLLCEIPFKHLMQQVAAAHLGD